MARAIASGVISWKTIRRVGTFGLSSSRQVPRDGLALAVLVSGEVELVGVLEQRLELGDLLLLVGWHDVERLEVVVDVDAEPRPRLSAVLFRDFRRLVGHVANVADARLDHVPLAEVAGDGPGLGRGLHDHQPGAAAVAGAVPLLAAAPLSPFPEAAAVLPAALLLAGTLFPTSHPRHGPSRQGRLPATLRRDSHRKYHTRRGHEMPVPAVIPATRLAVQTVPEWLCHTAAGRNPPRNLPGAACAARPNGSTIRGNGRVRLPRLVPAARHVSRRRAAHTHGARGVRFLGTGQAPAVCRRQQEGYPPPSHHTRRTDFFAPRRSSNRTGGNGPASGFPSSRSSAVSSSRSSTRTPNRRPSSGTRSSMPWNMPGKSSSGGSRSGLKPKQRMPSLAEPLRVGPRGQAVGRHDGLRVFGAQRGGHRVPQVTVRRGLERDVVVDELPGDRVPSSRSISAKNSSSRPGRNRPSSSAVAVCGMTLTL